MKKVVTLCCLMLSLITLAKAQSPTKMITHSHDFLVVQLSYDRWIGATDSIHAGGLSRGLNVALMYDFPLQKGSHLSVAPGLGVSASSIFLKNQTLGMNQASSTLNFKRDSSYKHYKIATAFVEVPIELRYRTFPDNANKGFKAGVGLKFGALLNAHTKGKKILYGAKEVDKVSSKRYFQNWRVVATARVGWGNFSLFTNYTLTSLLKAGAGPTLNPIQFGLCLSGL
jgi:hypothetical protein